MIRRILRMAKKCIEISTEKNIGRVSFNRPDVNNVLNHEMIRDISLGLTELNANKNVRVIIFEGKGKVFCAGADLEWMLEASKYSYEGNYEDSLRLATCFHNIYSSKKITIALLHGGVYGGGNGILAACDFAFATVRTTFAFSEVKHGLIPATIAPYIIKKIGVSITKELMLTGEKFNEERAVEIGLINKCFDTMDLLKQHLGTVVDKLLATAPDAQKEIKLMINYLSGKIIDADIVKKTAEFIAKTRQSAEAKDGMEAFLEKRKPPWLNHDLD